MKKIFTYLLIILLLGSVFGIIVSSNSNVTGRIPVMGKVLDVLVMPTIAYADSTKGGIPTPPPAIP